MVIYLMILIQLFAKVAFGVVFAVICCLFSKSRLFLSHSLLYNRYIMKYSNVVKAKFIERINRFEAYVELDDKRELVHVKNTGRCTGVLLPGVSVVLERSSNPNRKTRYDLIAAYKAGFGIINLDSQAPNKVAKEWLDNQGYDLVRPEYTYGKSRIDFYMEKDGKKYLCEVKGCTLEKDGIGYFPDAPTDRGVKHLQELSSAVAEGYHTMIAFVIGMNGIEEVRPNADIHPEFAEAFEEARAVGVEIVFVPCIIGEDTFEAIV